LGSTVSAGTDRARLLALSREWAEGYRLGYEHGYRDGWQASERDLAASYHAMAAPVARGGPSYAELERRRWTVHGEQRTRETFGLPHPADRRPGREAGR
jgi:hypothetical protein